MNALLRVIALATVSALAAGCGGGGSSAVTLPQSTPSAAPVPQGKAVGAGTLTIVFPPTFQRASKAGTARASAARRAPAYVNPTNGNLIDVYVDGTLQYNLDGVTPSDSATVSSGVDGTQTLSIPLYSTATNDIAIVEWDGTKSNVLAVGENSSTAFSPGTAPVISVSLFMNVQGIALSTSSVGFSASPLTTNSSTSAFVGCGPSSPATNNVFYLFATDASGGLIVPDTATTTGYGGSVLAGLSSQTPTVAGPIPTVIRPYNGGYAISYDAAADPITIYASVPSNPAATVFSNSTAYPSFTNVSALSGLSSYVNSGNAYYAVNGYLGATLSPSAC